VREVWLVEPVTRAVELFILADGDYVAARAPLISPALGVERTLVDGPLLRLAWNGESTEI
jgi:hypothetical protein